MAILQTLIAFALQSMSRIVTAALGWATVVLFGRVPRERQLYLSLIVFASIVWMVVVFGIAWPPGAAFLLAFARVPAWVNETLLRLAMLACAGLIPLLVGAAALLLRDPSLRPSDVASRWRAILSGYRFTLGIAVTLAMTVLFVPALQVRNLFRRWSTRHFPVVVRPPDYAAVVADTARALTLAGVPVRAAPAQALLRIPTALLVALAGDGADRVVARQLTALVSHEVEIVVHPFDLAISGPATVVARVQAVLAEHLPFTHAYLTWSKTGNEMEDRIKRLCRDARATADPAARARATAALDGVHEQLTTANLAFEEWEILFRTWLLTERRAGLSGDQAVASGP